MENEVEILLQHLILQGLFECTLPGHGWVDIVGKEGWIG